MTLKKQLSFTDTVSFSRSLKRYRASAVVGRSWGSKTVPLVLACHFPVLVTCHHLFLQCFDTVGSATGRASGP